MRCRCRRAVPACRAPVCLPSAGRGMSVRASAGAKAGDWVAVHYTGACRHGLAGPGGAVPLGCQVKWASPVHVNGVSTGGLA